MSSNIFLVGPMGAGKTTVGRQLAKALKMQFFDSDHEIEQRTGVSIPLIFDIEGEAGFREREKKMIDELTQKSNVVLATGGGVVLNPENRQHLATRGTVIYLKAKVTQLFKRTAKDRNRPLLQNDDPKGKLQQLMEARQPLYLEVADFALETDGRTVKQVVKNILYKLKQAQVN
jgi:shikimate kinase